MGYSQLPEDIVKKIWREKLDTVSQAIAFAGVCKSWRSLAIQPENLRCISQLPGLVMSEKSSSSDSSSTIHYCHPPHHFQPLSQLSDSQDEDVSQRRRRTVDLLIHNGSASPDEQNHRVRVGRVKPSIPPAEDNCFEYWQWAASKDGWLVLVGPSRPSKEQKQAGQVFDICVANPASGAYILIPPVELGVNHPWADVVERVILSSSPTHHTHPCYLIILLNSTPHLKWFEVVPTHTPAGWQSAETKECLSRVDDAAFYGGKLYVLNGGRLYISNTFIANHSFGQQLSWSWFKLPSAMPPDLHDAGVHLCQLGGEMAVVYSLQQTAREPFRFKIYKRAVDGNAAWEQVRSLKGYVMFLGCKQSFCIPTAEPDRDNCIYFAYDTNGRQNPKFNYKCGRFTLEDQRSESFLPNHSRCQYGHRYRWFQPMPWDILNYEKFHDKEEQKNNEEEEEDEDIPKVIQPAYNRFDPLTSLPSMPGGGDSEDESSDDSDSEDESSDDSGSEYESSDDSDSEDESSDGGDSEDESSDGGDSKDESSDDSDY